MPRTCATNGSSTRCNSSRYSRGHSDDTLQDSLASRNQHPPRHATTDGFFHHPHDSNSGGKWQFVWPNDKPRGPTGRIKDILTGKGPHIFISRQGDPGIHRSTWSGWDQHISTGNLQSYGSYTSSHKNTEVDFLGEEFAEKPISPCAGGNRRKGRVYDFQTRKYVTQDKAVLSDARRSSVRWSGDKPARMTSGRNIHGRSIDPPRFSEERPSYCQVCGEANGCIFGDDRCHHHEVSNEG